MMDGRRRALLGPTQVQLHGLGLGLQVLGRWPALLGQPLLPWAGLPLPQQRGPPGGLQQPRRADALAPTHHPGQRHPVLVWQRFRGGRPAHFQPDKANLQSKRGGLVGGLMWLCRRCVFPRMAMTGTAARAPTTMLAATTLLCNTEGGSNIVLLLESSQLQVQSERCLYKRHLLPQ